jgi:hypothetical protein
MSISDIRVTCLNAPGYDVSDINQAGFAARRLMRIAGLFAMKVR